MTATGTRRVSPRFRRLAIAAFIVLVPFALHALWDYIEARRLSRAVEAIRQRGEPVHLGTYGEGRPVTPEQKEASRYYGAAAILANDARGPRFTEAGKTIEALSQLSPSAAAADPRLAQLADLSAAYAPALELVDRAAAMDARGLDYAAERRYGFPALELANANAPRVARLAFLGEGGKAAEALVSTLRLDRVFRQNPLFLPVRTSGSLRVVLMFGAPSEAALRTLQAEYARDEGDRAVQEYMMRSRARLIEAFWPGAYGELPTLPRVRNRGPREPPPILGVLIRPWRTNRLTAALRRYEEAIDAAKHPWPAKLEAARSVVEKYPNPREPFGTPMSWRRRFSLPVAAPSAELGFATPHVARLTAQRRADVVVVAIERYRLTSGGAAPDDLSQLVPAYLAEVPRDPYSGQPLRYARDERGYKVYSIGANAIDDGGDWDVNASDLIVPPRGAEPKDIGSAIDTALQRRGQ